MDSERKPLLEAVSHSGSPAASRASARWRKWSPRSPPASPAQYLRCSAAEKGLNSRGSTRARLPVPERDLGGVVWSHLGQPPLGSFLEGGRVDPDKLVRSQLDRDWALGGRPVGEAGHPENARLLLDPARVGDHQARLCLEPDEVGVVHRLDELQVAQARKGDRVETRLGARMNGKDDRHRL